MTKDKIFNWRFCLCCGLFVWFVVNLLQGIFTEIQEDEAYYHLWGEHLDWGYFDHPPMVALMTFLSSKLFSGTLGVRFFTIIASCLTLFVIWKIASFNCLPKCDNSRLPQNDNSWLPQCDSPTIFDATLLFFTLAFSIVMFNIYGFVATPDSALILFSALFLLVYQQYLQDQTWKNALLMGLTMALMVYSKYHAFLLLGLIVLSNLRLLKDGKFYVACLVALALLTPHILWQIHADFPSFRYHLSGRSEPFRWSYFWEYLPNQLLIFNPFTFGAVVYVLIKDRNCVRIPPAPLKRGTPTGVFERGLKFILIGFFFFFWLMAFRGHVEPHWTFLCVIPAVILVYRKALNDEKLRKYIQRFVMASVLVIMVARIILMTPLAARFGFNQKESYYQAVNTVAESRPVVFRGSFQRPALYHYFTGKESSTVRGYFDRTTQYDLWQFDKAWIGKEVLVCGKVPNLSTSFKVDKTEFDGYLMQRFESPNRLEKSFRILNSDTNGDMVFHRGDTIRMEYTIHNPCDAPVVFRNPDFIMGLRMHYLPGDGITYCFYEHFAEIAPHATLKGPMFTIVNNQVALGKHRLTLGISDCMASYVTAENGIEITIAP